MLEKLGYSDIRSICLLYTSDAADERSSVDLGGRRIIKKKKKRNKRAKMDSEDKKRRADTDNTHNVNTKEK